MKENWTYKKLGEVCEIYQPQTISTEMLVPDGEYRVYGANGIIGRYDKYNHAESEVLLTCRGATCGSINVSAPYSWINGNAMVIHPIDDSVFCSRSFLVYLMKSIDYSLVITGAAQPQITRQKLSPVKIAIPPIETQSRIVSELDLLQSIIDKQQTQLKELDNLAQSIFYDMFGDPVENEKGWEVKKLGEVCDVVSGYAFPSPDFSANNPIKVIKITNVGVGEFVFDDSALPEKYSNLTAFMANYGDIAIALTRTIISTGLKRAIVPLEYNNALVNQRVAILKCSSIEPSILYYYLGAEYVRNYVLEHATAILQPNLSVTDLRKMPIFLPSLSLQQSFAAKIESIEKQKTAISKSIAETEKLFGYTMDKYFG